MCVITGSVRILSITVLDRHVCVCDNRLCAKLVVQSAGQSCVSVSIWGMTGSVRIFSFTVLGSRKCER